jgi:uncharacterized membrane protein (DUF106 family)
MHPLSNNLSGLSDDELHNKLNELNKRFMQAYRIGPAQIIPQIQMLIEDYNAEISKRNAKKMQEMQDRFDKASKKEDGKGLKGIIDIQ